jgi:hypothetical protein
MANESFFSKLFAFKFTWITKLFHNANHDFLSVAIALTNTVKVALQSKILDFLTSLTPTKIDDNVLAALRVQVPIILSDELLIQASGSPTTEADAQALGQKLIDSFGALSDEKKEKLYTTVAAQIYIFLQDHNNGQKVTFGQAATLVEGFYQDWLNSQSESQ